MAPNFLREARHGVTPTGSFRAWMELLRRPRGAEPEWPLLLRRVLADAKGQTREPDAAYAGKVCKSRDDLPVRTKLPKRRAVKELFRHCHEATDGVLRVSEATCWAWNAEAGQERGKGPPGRRGRSEHAERMAVFECKL